MSAAEVLRPSRVVDGNGVPLQPGTMVRIEGGRIAGVGCDAQLAGGDARIEDLTGATLLPGFIDLHAYLSIDPDKHNPMGQMYGASIAQRRAVALRHMARDLAAGVTTMRVMGEGGGLDIMLRDAVGTGVLQGPAILASGVPVCASASHQAPPDGGADTPDQIRTRIGANAAAGADWIKLVVTGGVNAPGDAGRQALYDSTQIAIAVEAARKHGLPVAVAAHGGPAIRDVTAPGIASIEHCALMNDEEIGLLVASPVLPVLTLTRFFAPDGIAKSAAGAADILARLDEARARLAALVRSLGRAGKPFGLGSDNMHGRFGEEAVTAVALGATPAQAIAAMTGNAARLLQADGRLGRLQQGAAADLVAVEGDPLHDISAVTRISGIWRNGCRIVPTAMAESTALKRSAGT